MAFENEEAIPRGFETPNVYGPSDTPLEVQSSQLCPSIRKNDKVFTNAGIPWTSQPQISIETIWKTPNTFFIPSNTRNLIGNAAFNTWRRETQEVFGKAVYLNGVAYSSSNAHIETPALNTRNFTVVGVFKVNSTGGVGVCIINDADNIFLRNDGGNFSVRVGNTNYTGPAFQFGQVLNYVLTSTSTGVKLFINGKLVINGAVAPANTMGTTTEVWVDPIGGGHADMAVGLFAINAEGTEHNTARELSLNPWQIFKPIQNKIKHYIPQQPILPSKVGIPGLLEQSKRPWTSQPQIPVELDPSNPLSRDVIFFDIPSSTTLKNDGTGSFTIPSSIGLVRYIIENSYGFFFRNGNFITPKSTYFTLSRATSIATGNRGVVGYDVSSKGAYIKINSANRWRFSVYDTAQRDAIDITPPSLVNFEAICGTADGTTAKLYRNGTFISSVAAGSLAGSSSDIRIGASSGSGAGGVQSALVIVFSRALSDVEVKTLSENPWQIFKPLSYKQFVGKNTLPNIQVYRDFRFQREEQPKLKTQIDSSNPITKDLLLAATPFSEFSTAPTEIRYSKGEASCNKGILRSSPVIHGVANSTVLIVDHIVGPDSGQWWNSDDEVYRDSNQSYPNDLGIRLGSIKSYGIIKVGARDTLGTVRTAEVDIYSGNITAASGQRIIRVATVDANLLVTGWGNGVKYGTTTGLQGFTYNNPLPNHTGPSFGNPMVRDTVTRQSLALRWGRVLTDDEIRSVSENPWQVFQPIQHKVKNLPIVKPQPLLPRTYIPQGYTQQPFKANDFGAKVLASVGVSNNHVWDGLTGQMIQPLVEGTFSENLFRTPAGGSLPKVWQVPILFSCHEPFTLVITWRHNNAQGGEFTRYLYQLVGLNSADSFNFMGPDYSSFRRYYIRVSANYSGFAVPLGANDRLPANKNIVTVIRSEGLGGAGHIFDNIAAPLVTTAPTNTQYSGKQVRNLEFYSFKNGTFSIGSFVMWDKALSHELCHQLTRNPGLAFSSTGYPARLK